MRLPKSAPTLLLLLCGCSTTAPAPEPEPYWGALQERREKDPIGFFLTELDARLRAWSNFKLTASTPEEKRTLRLLEKELRQTTNKRFDEVLDQLETGPPKNRSVAAMALGFTGRAEARAALLAALSEDGSDLVSNALIGLGLLGMADTPVAQVCYILGSHRDSYVRTNAAFCLQKLAEAGAYDECMLDECQDALSDPEPGVRAQSAAVLGMLADPDAVEALGDLLLDEEALVASAAARSIAVIGRKDPHAKGDAARALVRGADQAGDRIRPAILLELMHLSEANYGDDLEAWREWAFRLD